MANHPIEGLMLTAMNSIKDMIDVNTIIGDPIESQNNVVIIPVSKVCFGFAAGGSEFNEETIDEYIKKDKESEEVKYKLPFGGGTGAGVSINPVAFIIIQRESVKVLPVNHSSTIDKLLDYVPDLLEKISSSMNKNEDFKKSITDILKENHNNMDKTKEEKEKKNEEYEFKYEEIEDLDD